jgi:hypothetical protein
VVRLVLGAESEVVRVLGDGKLLELVAEYAFDSDCWPCAGGWQAHKR